MFEMPHGDGAGKARKVGSPSGCVYVFGMGRRMGKRLVQREQSGRSIHHRMNGRGWFG